MESLVLHITIIQEMLHRLDHTFHMSMHVVATNRTSGEDYTMFSEQLVLEVSHVDADLLQGLHHCAVLVHHEVLWKAHLSCKPRNAINNTTVVRLLYDLAIDQSGYRASEDKRPHLTSFSRSSSEIFLSTWSIDHDWPIKICLAGIEWWGNSQIMMSNWSHRHFKEPPPFDFTFDTFSRDLSV